MPHSLSTDCPPWWPRAGSPWPSAGRARWPPTPALTPVVHAGVAEQQGGHALVPHARPHRLGDEHGVVAPLHHVGDPALEPVGQGDDEGASGFGARLEPVAVDGVALDRGGAEESLAHVEL